MKKSVIAVFLTITVAFAAFVAGFYTGRNYDRGEVHIYGFPEATTTQSAAAQVQPSSNTVPTPASTAALLVNINTATAEQLDLLPGIGPVIVQAIIDYRTEYGPFTAPEDLLNVSGIGEKKLAAILEFITTGG